MKDKIMKQIRVSAVLIAVSIGWLLTGIAVGQDGKISDMEQQFLEQAARAGTAEVKLGAMATERATSPEVQQFGQRMATDHTKANQELMAVAKAKDISVSTELDAQHQEAAEALSQMQGSDFDRAFMRHMVVDHDKAVQLFSTASHESEDTDIKAFATKTLPTLQEHLRMARQLVQQQEMSQAR
jgi:putative membrane protein